MSSCLSGRGAVWLACYLGVVEVAGSSPVAPTIFNHQIDHFYALGSSLFFLSAILFEVKILWQ